MNKTFPEYGYTKPEDRYEAVTETGCWIWNGATTDDGYGRTYHGKRRQFAHRWFYRLFVGEIPEGMNVLHRCDIRLCVNPAHLYAGTQIQNIRDRVSRGRGGGHKIAGENSVRRKLGWKEVMEIREIRAATNETYKSIAKKFSIGTSQVKRIIDNQSWRT